MGNIFTCACKQGVSCKGGICEKNEFNIQAVVVQKNKDMEKFEKLMDKLDTKISRLEKIKTRVVETQKKEADMLEQTMKQIHSSSNGSNSSADSINEPVTFENF